MPYDNCKGAYPGAQSFAKLILYQYGVRMCIICVFFVYEDMSDTHDTCLFFMNWPVLCGFWDFVYHIFMAIRMVILLMFWLQAAENIYKNTRNANARTA